MGMVSFLIPILMLIVILGVILWLIGKYLSYDDELDYTSFNIECQILKLLLRHGYEYYDAFRELYPEHVFYNVLTHTDRLAILHSITNYFNSKSEFNIDDFKKNALGIDDNYKIHVKNKIEDLRKLTERISSFKHLSTHLEPDEVILERIKNIARNHQDKEMSHRLMDLILKVEHLKDASIRHYIIHNILTEVRYTMDRQILTELIQQVEKFINVANTNEIGVK